jgi:hypothetical protein
LRVLHADGYGEHVSKDKDRPEKFKSHADTRNVRTICGVCMAGNHKECNGYAIKPQVKCLCANVFKHNLDD